MRLHGRFLLFDAERDTAGKFQHNSCAQSAMSMGSDHEENVRSAAASDDTVPVRHGGRRCRRSHYDGAAMHVHSERCDRRARDPAGRCDTGAYSRTLATDLFRSVRRPVGRARLSRVQSLTQRRLGGLRIHRLPRRHGRSRTRPAATHFARAISRSLPPACFDRPCRCGCGKDRAFRRAPGSCGSAPPGSPARACAGS